MTKIYTIFLAVLITARVFAQAPEKMSYQAVIRDSSDALVTSTEIGMQISILQGSIYGVSVYVETHNTTTNANGLVSIEIGNGTIESGDFTTIDWANDIYFIKTETAPTGGVNYTITGTSQLMSVPYALHAKTAETVENVTVNYSDVVSTPDLTNYDTNVNDDFDGQYSSLTGSPDNVSDFTNDAGYITTFSEVDGDITNEIQDLQLSGNILNITNNGIATEIDLSVYLDNTDTQLSDAEIATMGYIKSAEDSDSNASNEIQDLQLSGNILSITKNGIATEIDLSVYLDNTDTQLSDAEIATMGYIKSAEDSDSNASNEIQDLQLSGNILSITNNGTATEIDLSTYLNTNTQLSEAEVDDMVSDNGYLSTYTETDPTFNTSIAKGITAADIADWNNDSGALKINDLSDGKTDASSIFLGSGAGANDNGSNQNTAIGIGALNANTIGNNNTASGYKAGANSTGSGNIFLGANAGYNETGDNKLYIANSDDSTPLIYGDFTTDLLRVNGDLKVSSTIKIEGGSPGAGKVLTSDASGLASWQALSSALPNGAVGDMLTSDGTNWVAKQVSVSSTGSSNIQNNMQPFLTLNYCIALQGIYPSRNGSDPFLAEIMIFAGNLEPRGWAFCDGQLLPISTNPALFSLVGTIYGGDGRTTFGLPDLRGRTPIHAGSGPGLSSRPLGLRGGSETSIMNISQMPTHTHTITYQ